MEKKLGNIQEAIEMKVLGYTGMVLIGLLSLGAEIAEALKVTKERPNEA